MIAGWWVYVYLREKEAEKINYFSCEKTHKLLSILSEKEREKKNI